MERKEAFEIVRRNGLELDNMPDEFKKDYEIALEALKNDVHALQFVDKDQYWDLLKDMISYIEENYEDDDLDEKEVELLEAIEDMSPLPDGYQDNEKERSFYELLTKNDFLRIFYLVRDNESLHSLFMNSNFILSLWKAHSLSTPDGFEYDSFLYGFLDEFPDCLDRYSDREFILSLKLKDLFYIEDAPEDALCKTSDFYQLFSTFDVFIKYLYSNDELHDLDLIEKFASADSEYACIESLLYELEKLSLFDDYEFAVDIYNIVCSICNDYPEDYVRPLHIDNLSNIMKYEKKNGFIYDTCLYEDVYTNGVTELYPHDFSNVSGCLVLNCIEPSLNSGRRNPTQEFIIPGDDEFLAFEPINDFNPDVIRECEMKTRDLDKLELEVKENQYGIYNNQDEEKIGVADYSWGYPQFYVEKKWMELDDEVRRYLLENKITICLDDVIVDYKLMRKNYGEDVRMDDYDFDEDSFLYSADSQWLYIDKDNTDFKSLSNLRGKVIEFNGTVKEWMDIKYNELKTDETLLVICDDGTVESVKVNHMKSKFMLLYISTNRGFENYQDDFPSFYIDKRNYFGLIYYVQRYLIMTEGRGLLGFMGQINFDSVIDQEELETALEEDPSDFFDVLDYDNFLKIRGIDGIS